MLRRDLVLPYLLAFFAGFQILVVELCGGRYINLYLGSSIYGWTSLIGVVLGGVSLGNFLGGTLATQPGIRRHLGTACLMSALLTLVVLRLNPILTYAVTDFGTVPWGLRVFLVVSALLLPPSIAMGLISPMAARWALAVAPDRPGAVLGTMSALGTWGAIIGTFLTGFILIGKMGTASLLLTTMSLMGLLGIWLLGAQRLRLGPVPIGWLPFALITFGMVWTWPLPGHAGAIHAAQLRWSNAIEKNYVLYVDESDYFTIKVVTEDNNAPQRTLQLVLDHLVHGYIVEGEPTRLEYSYEHTYSWVTRRWGLQQQHGDPSVTLRPRALYLGGGSYTFPRWVESLFPHADQLVSEIDPRVVEAVYAKMELPRDTAIRTIAEDARRVIETEQDGTWDLIFGDAFNGFSVPYHLTTLELCQQIKRLLAPGGVYQMNIIDLWMRNDQTQSRFVASMVRTLDLVFGEDHIHVWVDDDVPHMKNEGARSTFVIVATTSDLSLDQLGDPARDVPPSPGQAMSQMLRLTPAQMVTLRASGTVLTDDFCPVDQLLAPVAATRSEMRTQ